MTVEQTINSTTEIPWYKQFWSWVLVFLPGSVVIACIVTIVLSIRYSDELVVGDYYRAGLGINDQIRKQNFAKKINIMVSFSISDAQYDASGNLTKSILRCNLSSNQEANNNYIVLYFRHSINAIFDKTVRLNRTNITSIFEVPNFSLAKGSYHLTIESNNQQWQITQRLKQIKLLEGLLIKL